MLGGHRDGGAYCRVAVVSGGGDAAKFAALARPLAAFATGALTSVPAPAGAWRHLYVAEGIREEASATRSGPLPYIEESDVQPRRRSRL